MGKIIFVRMDAMKTREKLLSQRIPRIEVDELDVVELNVF